MERPGYPFLLCPDTAGNGGFGLSSPGAWRRVVGQLTLLEAGALEGIRGCF